MKDKLKKLIEKRKKIIIGIMIPFCTLFIIYFGMVKYFTTHFYFGTEINSISVSGKTEENAKKILKSKIQDYTLNIKERGNKSEQIKANDVGLKYNCDKELKKLKEDQNSFKWILAIFASKDSKMTGGFSYDEKLLKQQVEKLSCFNKNNIIEPKNPSFKYENNKYVIVDEVLGNKIDKDVLYSHIADAILKGEAQIDLETIGCYIKPQYNSKSQKVIEAKNMLNKYAASKITYTFGERKEILDGSTINKWLKVDENLNVNIDNGKVKDYIASLANTYNTIGKTRSFTTSYGNKINISGGDYGRAIDVDKDIQNLNVNVAIKEGKTITKEPKFSQTPFSKDNNEIGNTYVEIDMAKQHLWFYKKGALIAQGNVVTGNVSSNHRTPAGIYRFKYKQRNAVLRGPGYACPVSFWMPFNGEIGIHDASWRPAFGGNIYRTNGSHGCVNLPYNLAQTIFNNIESGIPIICY